MTGCRKPRQFSEGALLTLGDAARIAEERARHEAAEREARHRRAVDAVNKIGAALAQGQRERGRA